MDPSVWRGLPDDLLDRILSLLPLRSILSLRPTCKRFSSLLQTPSFLSLLSSSSSSSSFLLLSHPQFSRHSLPIYDSSTDYWKTITLSSSSSLLSSSYGLLLFSLGPSSSSLLVSNILTNSSTIIPSPPTLSSSPPSSTTTTTIIISFPSPSPHGFYIFLSNSNSSWVHLYRSHSHSWTRFPAFRSPLLSHSTRNGVFFNGSLYFTTPEPEPLSVLAFHLDTGTWAPPGTTTVPTVPDDLAFARLVSGKERLFLVGGVGSDGISRSLVVWEMVGGRRWEEVGRLPDLMCRKFVSVCYHNYSHVYCLWQEGMVCVCCTTWPEVLFLKVGRGTWHWLPRCPLLQEKWSCGFRWFSFAPDLYALV